MTRILSLLLSTLLLSACASPDTAPDAASVPDTVSGSDTASVSDTTTPPALPWLRAEGTAVVDEDGAPVTLRGVNLGGWLFHETWLTLVDYSFQSRLLQVALEEDLYEDIAPVLLDVGPAHRAGLLSRYGSIETGDDIDAWLDDLRPGLEEAIGEEAVTAFLAELAAYRPGLYADSDLPLRDALEERFGWEARDELQDLFMGAWVQEADIAWIAAQGFNLVRVGMSWRALMAGPGTESPAALEWNEAALARLDTLLDWCRAHGVYAILDVQEAPGGQNDYSHEGRLYEDETMQALTVALWETLSARYAGRSEVAAYSLLAEPLSAPNTQARDAMYDRLVQAVRGQGDEHLLVIHDGFLPGGPGGLPHPDDYGWTNVVYSTHLFEWNAESRAQFETLLLVYETQFRAAQEANGVPFYLGSFSPIWDAPWAYESAALLVDWCEDEGYPWSVWTYKRVDDPLEVALWDDTSAWGLRSRVVGDFARPDIVHDDLATLREKFAAYATLELAPNGALLDALLGERTEN